MASMDPATARPSIEEIFRNIEDHSVLQVWGCEQPARACDGPCVTPRTRDPRHLFPKGTEKRGGANSGRTIQSGLRLARVGCLLQRHPCGIGKSPQSEHRRDGAGMFIAANLLGPDGRRTRRSEEVAGCDWE